MKVLNKYNIFYIYVLESRSIIVVYDKNVIMEFFCNNFKGSFVIVGGYIREEGNVVIVCGRVDLIVYGRLFLLNFDLFKCFELKVFFNSYDCGIFYNNSKVKGYIDYFIFEELNLKI